MKRDELCSSTAKSSALGPELGEHVWSPGCKEQVLKMRTCPATEEKKKEKAKQGDALFSSVPTQALQESGGFRAGSQNCPGEVRWGE